MAGVGAVRPERAIGRFCRLEGQLLTIDGRPFHLDSFDEIVVLGAGKGGASMAKALEELLGKRITRGAIVVKYQHIEALSTVKILEAAHPVPDENGYRAAREMYRLARDAGEKTLVICLISGGGSALLPYPVAGVSLADKQETTRILLACGANIHEINAIRKHLSVIKGGGLARAVYPATLVSLILSDVIGDDLDTIASGPCVPDRTTFSDCLAIFEKYGVVEQIPLNVIGYIRKGSNGEVPETAKVDEPIFEKTANVIIGGNFDALVTAKSKAEELGYNTLLLSSQIEGETREIAASHVAIAREVKMHGQPVPTPACILSGGETTVTIHGQGKGGRAQEFALAAAIKMEGLTDTVILCAGTDGSDGPTDAAGAVCDTQTVNKALEKGLYPEKYLAANDSYHFFDTVGGLYKTGPTNTNVMDIRVVLVK
ncbi:MAG: glycerate kinase [Deltaproteobacteria bacterium]|nr:MAG: glycerate kinase [Deltaproteobacteria bacterium]